ncbi:MAG: pectate lyase [Kiritimatiellae bacterium]|nr:pectate lyase [Kiritimatiellia bacterium]
MAAALVAGHAAGSAAGEGGRLLAFPGAAGFGRFARGARASASPEVYHVTSLADAGPGTLRDAVSKPGRIVVFDVAGVIRIKSRISFAKNLYVAGQSAPGGGVTVYGDGCSFSGADDLICRHLRWRMGKCGGKGKDCAGISRGENMIFDHCSFSWGRDETFSVNPDKKGRLGDITIQNCIIGQGLLPHSAGGLIQAERVTVWRNLFVDNSTRNNKVKGTGQYANNIVYNWKNGCFIMGGGSKGESSWNIAGNLFINGPDGGGDAFTRGNGNFHFWGRDNWQDADRDGKLDPKRLDGTMTGGGDEVKERFGYPALKLVPAKTLPKALLGRVGASVPRRDPADDLMVEEARSFGKKGALIGSEDSLACGPPGKWRVEAGKCPEDTDGDGMPDAWERRNGTDFRKPDATEKAKNGYLNIENYLDSLTTR